MNARYYLPEVGRFASPDTLVPDPGNPQSFNRYSYALNSPTNFIDPSGHAVCRPGEGLCRNPIDFEPISFDTGNNTGNAAVSLMVNLGCGLIGGWCKAENNTIAPTSDSEWTANIDPSALVNPIAMAGGRIVMYGGKGYSADFLEAVLARGKPFAIDSSGHLVERSAGAVKEFDVIRYGARTLRKGSGLEAHHGVMDAFFRGRIKGYSSVDAPAIMLHSADHNAANEAFNNWAIERFGSVNKVDWSVISDGEMISLAQQMFNAAGVPYQAQSNYFAAFWHYINQLGQ
jgi:hypothetical protein